MRRILLAAVTAALLLGTALPAAAHPNVALDPTLPTDLTYKATDNIEYLGRFPEHAGTAGGTASPDGTRFFVTDPRGVFAYDTTKPETPALLGFVPLYQHGSGTGAALAQEDPNTNGKILLVDGSPSPYGLPALQIVDVSDPAKMKVLSSVPIIDHTWTCVSGTDATGADNSCAYAYGRSGHIVDLTDPAAAKLLPNSWRKPVGYGDKSNSPYTHDLTEIRPGLVMSSGSTAILMDTRNPAAPVRLAAIEQRNRFSSLGYHSVEWANGGRDPYVVLGTEIAPSGTTNAAGSDCKGDNSVIETWDASTIVTAIDNYEAGMSHAEAFAGAAFTKVDAYQVSGRGLFLDGNAPAHVLYCAHWMELHPDFDGGGLMAVSYYDRGTRIVEVGTDGTMSEKGWIVPAEGYSGSPQWISGDVVYIMDYRRGMEVIRLKAAPATGVTEDRPAAIAVGSQYVPPSALHLHKVQQLTAGSFGLLLVGFTIKRRRRAASLLG
jgi:hypothetical protein